MTADRQKLTNAIDWTQARLSRVKANIQPLTVNGNFDQAESAQLAIRYAEEIFDAFVPTLLDAVSVACSLGDHDATPAALDGFKERLWEALSDELYDAREWADEQVSEVAA
ncbi:hypothetical protein CSC94_12605 [Zhengella mangrovi]|uniref:Uncharacterized protein n=1 Tax=Zhengella mangrovi TaxID=1982044 RepID=A0A2G1QLW9_9HYPH|nr:hypothetical protein [Zhengella mangrovi]PHP66527.1 hypothetical protein CSC94_12605 [Zhengella mangrovi]